jgi:hypothetical protein
MTGTTTPVVPSAAPRDLLITPAAETRGVTGLLGRASWSAIFSGAAVAAVLQVWFNLLGLAIGAAVYDPSTVRTGDMQGFGIGTVIWVLASTIISLFCGGWVAGHFSRTWSRGEGALHGVVAWSVASLFGLYVLTAGIGRIASSAANVAGPALAQGGASSGASGQVEGTGSLQGPSGTVYQGQVGGEQGPSMSSQEGQGLAPRSEKAANALSAVAFLGVASMFLGLGSSALGGAVACKESGRGGEASSPIATR